MCAAKPASGVEHLFLIHFAEFDKGRIETFPPQRFQTHFPNVGHVPLAMAVVIWLQDTYFLRAKHSQRVALGRKAGDDRYPYFPLRRLRHFVGIGEPAGGVDG